MSIIFGLYWIVVLSVTFMVLLYLLQYLLTMRSNSKALIGLIAMSTLAISAIIGLVIAQVHPISNVRTISGPLILTVLFSIQIIYQWTFPNKLMQNRYWRIFLKVFTGFAIVYAAFALVVLIFHL